MMSNALKLRQRLLRPLSLVPGGVGLGRVAVEPAGHVVVVQLLAPQHPGECLPHHPGLVGAGRRWRQLGIELVGLGLPLRHYGRELGPRAAGCAGISRSLPQRADRLGGRSRTRSCAVAPAASVSLYQKAHLVPRPAGLTVGRTADDVIVDAVLRERRDRLGAEQPGDVGLVLAEQRLGRHAVRTGSRQQFHLADERMGQRHASAPVRDCHRGEFRLAAPSSQDQVLRNHAVGSTCNSA